MYDITREQLCAVIEGRAEGKNIPIPLLYDIWIYPGAFGDRQPQAEQLIAENPRAAEILRVQMPDSLPDRPEYTWGKRKDTGKKGIDGSCIITDWENADEVADFYAHFPNPEFPELIPASFHPAAGKYILANWWYTLFERHWSLRGMENALTDYYLYPDEVHTLFRRLTDYYCRIMERLRTEAKVDGLFISDDIGTQTGAFFSLEVFRTFFKPYYKELIDKAHCLGMHFWLHSCGDIEIFLEDFIEIGLDVIHPIQRHTTMDARTIAEKYGSRICIFAGFDVQQTIPFGTEQEVREEVRYLIDSYARADGRFMLTMGNGATPDWKIESLQALYDESIHYLPSRLQGI